MPRLFLRRCWPVACWLTGHSCRFGMSSGMTNQPNLEQGTLAIMEDLAVMLRAEVLPTHLPLVQLIGKICEDPTLKQEDLYSKYTRLAAVVGVDWITVKEELRNATRFGAPAFYCSISAMLAVFTCRRSRSHDELVSSLTELYNHISVGNEALNKQVENAINTIGKQMEQANQVEVSIANVIEQADNCIEKLTSTEPLAATAIEKSTEVIKQDNVEVVAVPGTTFRCKYGTLVIDDQSQCSFNGSSLEAKILAQWVSLPVRLFGVAMIMNHDLEEIIKFTKANQSFLEDYCKIDVDKTKRLEKLNYFRTKVDYKPGQWSYIGYA